MTRRLLLAAAAAITLTVLAPAGASSAASLPARYIVPGQNVFPEGIAREHGTPRFYVSSAANGTIYRGNLNRPRMHVFLPGGRDGRTGATGIEVRDGLLYVSGADTGRVFIYSTATGELVKAFRTAPVGFLNDVAIVRSGAAFFTDSLQPVLYRVTTRALAEPGDRVRRLVPWLRFAGTPIQYEDGFNLNGIVATGDGRFLLAVQSNTGELFRIDLRTKAVVEVGIAGGDLTAGDGMLLRGHRLFVAQNAINQITIVRLGRHFRFGSIVGGIGDSSFSTPTTIEAAREHLLVVNSQFNAQPPAPPFTVSTVPIP